MHHCFSDFRGDDFRPTYRRLGKLRALTDVNVKFMALTATANDSIRKEIFAVLLFDKPISIWSPMRRDLQEIDG